VAWSAPTRTRHRRPTSARCTQPPLAHCRPMQMYVASQSGAHRLAYELTADTSTSQYTYHYTSASPGTATYSYSFKYRMYGPSPCTGPGTVSIYFHDTTPTTKVYALNSVYASNSTWVLVTGTVVLAGGFFLTGLSIPTGGCSTLELTEVCVTCSPSC